MLALPRVTHVALGLHHPAIESLEASEGPDPGGAPDMVRQVVGHRHIRHAPREPEILPPGAGLLHVPGGLAAACRACDDAKLPEAVLVGVPRRCVLVCLVDTPQIASGGVQLGKHRAVPVVGRKIRLHLRPLEATLPSPPKKAI
eukprot:scaffold93405_cov28-Prasinocladus_malaysianus.AAC.10